MIIFVGGIILTLFEAIAQKMFFESFKGKSSAVSKNIDRVYVIFIWISLLSVAFINIDTVILKPLITITVIAVMMFIYYREHPIQIFIMANIFSAMLIAVDYLTILMVKYLFQDEFKVIWNNQIKAIFIALASKTIVFMIVVIIGKAWNKDDSFNLISDSEWIRFLYFPVLTIVAITILLAERNDMSNSILIIGFGLVIMNLLIFYMIRDIVSREKNIQNMRLTDERTRNQLEMYESMNETYESQRKYVHDFKNQISCIHELLDEGNNEEALNYVSQISDRWINEINYVNTNNAIANAVLNQKLRQAKNNNISIAIFSNDLGNIKIDKQDMVTILANLLDNAIEACERLEKNRVISFKFVDKAEEILISLKNPVDKPMEIRNNIIQTTKKNKKEHGIGMKNIQMVIEKYSGQSSVSYEKGYFYYNAVIPK